MQSDIMVDGVLYDDGKIKVTYLYSPESGKENEVVSREDHELWINDKDGEWNRYIIQRGILKDLSIGLGDDSKLISMLYRVSPYIIPNIRSKGIDLKDIKEAILGACKKENEEFEKYLPFNKRSYQEE